MKKAEMSQNGLPTMRGSICKNPGKPFSTAFVGANFIIPGKALQKTPFDPYLAYLFYGEEILFSARLWTQGYNFYSPSKVFTSHNYGRQQKPKYWTDHKSLQGKCQNEALRRARKILGIKQDHPPTHHFAKNIESYKPRPINSDRTVQKYFQLIESYSNTKLNFALDLQ
jgi:hypothetical protein